MSLEDRRSHRLRAFLKLIALVTSLTLVAFAVWGSAIAATGSMVMLTSSLLSLFALARGARTTPVVILFLLVAVGVQVSLAVLRGSQSLPSLFWLTMAPAVAMGIGGRRAGWVMLAATIVLDVLALAIIQNRWVEPVLEHQLKSSGIGPVATAVCGMCITLFLIARWYDLESERTISEVSRRNDELSLARQEADQANRAKSDFLATISHELRTPLNGVLGMTALLLDESHATKVVEGLQLIQRSGETLRTVISDVLDFSKIESSQLTLEAVAVSASDELCMVAQLLTPQAAAQNNVITIDVEPQVPPWFIGDPTRVRQVMLNLVSNAVKFTSDGRIDLRLAYAAGVLTLTVTDSGIGMSPEASARIFVPFVQADSSTTRRFGGSGLGLVITRRLVEAMKGSVVFSSKVGQGTAFSVRLPIELTQPPTRDIEVVAEHCEPKRVLLVEDNTVNQVVAARLIERLGHQVVVAANGEEALRCFSQSPFDLILMDCHMPVLDGFEATRQLRREGVRLPIVALTAAVSRQDHERCIEAGMNDVLTKPIQLKALSRLLGIAPRSG